MATLRGTLRADAILLDVALIGEAEARRRVLALWCPGSGLRRTPDGAWLVLPGTPVELRAERAPGLALALVEPGVVEAPVGGRTVRWRVDALDPIDVAGWVDLDGFDVQRLTPLDPPPRPPAVLPATRTTRPDLRSVAQVGAPPRRGRRGFDTGLLGGPLGPLLRRRNAAYVDGLARRFRQGRWDEALRQAIALGGSADALPSLRLPQARTGPLRPTPRRAPASRAVAMGEVHARLREMYVEAADRLAADGRLELAAFIHADLLDQPTRAVALLEQAGETVLAAELAEARGLDAAQVVGLWWRAGRRERAVDVARTRGAFAAALVHLDPADPDAYDLRAAWVHACRAAGDRIAAVEAAWPDERLRPAVTRDLIEGIAIGGPVGAHMLAYLISDRVSADLVTSARALLDSREPAHEPAQRRFVQVLARQAGREPAQDRQVCTAALRTLVRLGPAPTDADWRQVYQAIRERADGLLAADLPAVPARVAPGPGTIIEVDAGDEPGQLPVRDAVTLSSGTILVAHGGYGVRLLTLDGRVRASWPVPADRLVVADHGSTALVVADHEGACELSRLDLVSRRLRRWATLRARTTAETFDGGLLAVVDDDGVAFVDTLADQPRVTWRELGPGARVHRLSRTPDSLAALFTAPDAPGAVQLWRWDLPALTLRYRTHVETDGVATADVLADGTMVALAYAEEGGLGLRVYASGSTPVLRALPADAGVATSGNAYAVWTPGLTVDVGIELGPRPVLRSVFPGGTAVGLRVHGRLLTIWDARGRILTYDLDQRQVVANLRTSL